MKRTIWLLIFALGLVVPMIARAKVTFDLPSGVRIDIVEERFDSGVFKIIGCGEKDKTCLINGRIPFGVSFGLPKTYLKAIKASYRGRSFSLDVSDMYDAWGTRPLEVKGAVRYFGGKCLDSMDCQFRGIFSDGAGSFVAEWRIVNGLPIRTVLTDSGDVVDLFMRQIDPPEFD